MRWRKASAVKARKHIPRPRSSSGTQHREGSHSRSRPTEQSPARHQFGEPWSNCLPSCGWGPDQTAIRCLSASRWISTSHSSACAQYKETCICWVSIGHIVASFSMILSLPFKKQTRFFSFRWFIKTILFKPYHSMLAYDYNSPGTGSPVSIHVKPHPLGDHWLNWSFWSTEPIVLPPLKAHPWLPTRFTRPDMTRPLFALLPPSFDAHSHSTLPRGSHLDSVSGVLWICELGWEKIGIFVSTNC